MPELAGVLLWIIAAVVGLLVLGKILRRVLLYRRLLADAHFQETAQAIVVIRRAALDNIEERTEQGALAQSDPRYRVTSAGLVILHTITREGPGFVHHCSLSLGGGYTAHAVGSVYMALVTLVLGLDDSDLTVHITPAHRYHLEFILDEGQQAAFAARDVAVSAVGTASELHERCLVQRDRLKFLHVRPAPNPAP